MLATLTKDVTLRKQQVVANKKHAADILGAGAPMPRYLLGDGRHARALLRE